MKVENQTPIPKLEIFFPSSQSATEPDYTYYGGTQGEKWLTKLLGYSFRESVNDLAGSFSFSVENEETSDGRSIFDIIPIRSVIKIYEGDDFPRFVGMIRSRRFGATMTAQGVKRTIIFGGKSIISCVSEYIVSLDMKVQGVTDAKLENIKLLDEISKKDHTIKSYVIDTWNYFNKIANDLCIQLKGAANTAIKEIITRFIGEIGDFVTADSEQKLRYKISGTLINQSNNSVVDMWRYILPQGVYELYAYCDAADGKPKIMAREVPLGGPKNCDDWKNLKHYPISPVSLIAYDFEQSDEEVYTSFASSVVGSQMSPEFSIAVSNKQDSTIIHDPDKIGIYGFRPLQLEFHGYDRSGNTGGKGANELQEGLKSLNEKAQYWYSRLDDMYSGSLTLCADFIAPDKNPRIGCRAKFMGAEFYIEQSEHTWNYGGTPTIKLRITRGMMYDENGKIRDGQDGIIKNIGKRYRELEEENA